MRLISRDHIVTGYGEKDQTDAASLLATNKNYILFGFTHAVKPTNRVGSTGQIISQS